LETLSEVDPAIERDLGPPQPHLFRVLECSHPLAPSARHCLGEIDSVVIGRGERSCDRGSRIEQQLHVGVPDPWMSSTHARLLRRDGSWFIEDAGSRNGTLINGVPAERAALADGDVLELGRTFFLFRGEAASSAADPADLESSVLSPAVAELSSLSPPLVQELRRLVQIADSSVSVVVQGETGTGKERIAHAVHVLSRRPGAFVAVNCGALPDTLIETELFGCRRGAFTGAQDRPGLVRTADHGTLFLDEVGDLPLSAQVALLRVLQERQVHPVGATHPVPVDFRLISATQEPLEDLVKAGRFRSDLLARLAGVTVQLPPLRERREDLGIITATLLRRLAPERAATLAFDKEAARALLRHPFPLNIRELEKNLERALALAAGGPIRLEHLSLDMLPAPGVPRAAGTSPGVPLAPEDLELRHQLVALLGEHGGNLSATARSMGKARVQIRRWLRRYQIDLTQFRR
jgi:DNA-binding NtrC family response regulator